MSKVIKGVVIAAAIVATGGAAGLLLGPAGLGLMASAAGLYTAVNALALSAFINGVSAQLSGSSRGARPAIDVEYSGTIEPRRIMYGELKCSGMHVLPPVTTGTNNKFLHGALVVAGHEVNAITSVWFDQEQLGTISSITGTANDGKVTTGTFANKAWVRRYMGTSGQTVDWILDNALSIWTTNHRGRGVAYVAYQLEYDEAVYKTGKPTVSVLVQGKKCYDPRLDVSPGANPTNPAYIAYTANPALCLADYITDTSLGLAEAASRIDWTMVEDAADICDELVAVPTASTQKRYTCNIALLATTPYEQNIEALVACMLGSCMYSGGKWRIRAGAWEATSFVIGDANIVDAGVDVTTAYSYKDRWNGVRGSYIDPNNNYQPNEFPPVQNASYVTADGESVFKDTAFAGCINVYEAQRNAIMLVRKSRNRRAYVVNCDLSAWKIRPGMTGLLTVTELGVSAQTVRCEGWKLNPAGTVEVALRDELASDWNDPLEADYLTPLTISTPTPVYFTPDSVGSLTTSGVKNGILLTWTAPAIVPADMVYEVWEYTSQTPFASATKVWEGAALSVVIPKTTSGIWYYWVRPRTGGGVTGPQHPTTNGQQGQIAPVLEFPYATTGNAVAVDKGAMKVGGSSSWDSSIYSLSAYANGAFVSFRPAQQNVDFCIGLNADPTTNNNYTSIDYAFIPDSVGSLNIYESGTYVSTPTGYVTGDDLSITYDGALVRYFKNGSLLREVMAGPGRSFSLDSSFYGPGGAVADLRFGPYGTAAPVLFNARGNCAVSDSNALKVGGIGAWDSDVYSIRGYQNCHMSFKANDIFHAVMVGLGTSPLGSLSYASIDFAWEAEDTSGLAHIYELGTHIGAFGSYDATTVFAITYDGIDVRYLKNGVVVRTVNAPGMTLYVDSSFYTAGGGINSLRFGPTTNLAVNDTPQLGANAATEVYTASRATDTYNGSVFSSTGLTDGAGATIAATLPADTQIELTVTVEVECTTFVAAHDFPFYFATTFTSYVGGGGSALVPLLRVTGTGKYQFTALVVGSRAGSAPSCASVPAISLGAATTNQYTIRNHAIRAVVIKR